MSEKVDHFLAVMQDVPAKTLKQHGVKGMKWGIRRRRDSTSTPASRSSSTTESSSKSTSQQGPGKGNALRNKPQNKRLTDAELRARLNRLDMERRYAELTAPTPKANSFVKQLLADTGKQAARQVAQRATTVAIDLAIQQVAGNSKGSTKVFFEAMAANSKGKKNKN